MLHNISTLQKQTYAQPRGTSRLLSPTFFSIPQVYFRVNRLKLSECNKEKYNQLRTIITFWLNMRTLRKSYWD